ncbi:hypothetical protein BDW62DRAFT_218179 [Aspergillus aurantiobrunneus]
MFRCAVQMRVSVHLPCKPSVSARRWADIHHTAQYSAPSPGGVTRLCADKNDKLVRDWFREQILALGAEYKVNATGSQFAKFGGGDDSVPPIAMGSHLDTVATGGRFDGPLGVISGLEVIRSFQEQGIKTRAPLVLINWTNEEGARFFPPLGSSNVYAGQSSIEQAHASLANDGSGITMGGELAKIGYVGDGPNTFEEFPISAHFEVHVEQSTDLEKAGKPVGWVEGWHGITYYEIVFTGEDGHANTYPMYGRRDALTGAAKLITQLEKLAYTHNGYTTVTNIQSGPWGACNIQSKTKLVFCLMHREAQGLEDMGAETVRSIKSIAAQYGLEHGLNRPVHLLPGDFWPEAVECVRQACGDKGIGSRTGTGHDSTMTRLKCPTAMVFVRGKDGISHCAKEWSDKDDCAEGALVLGKAANPAAVVQGPTYRFTLFSERLIRFEWAEDSLVEDRASTFAINRDFPVPKFRVIDGDELHIITDHFHMSYTKEVFSPQSLTFHFSGKSIKYGAPWRFGTPTDLNLGGTARTLDGVDGRCDMGDGVLSKAGYAVVDDSRSMLFDGRGFVSPRRPGERYDCYLFCYGRDYKAAIKALYAVSGKQPVVPRYVLGNWWSRYYAYHQDEYVQLMDRFRAHNIPLSVAVLDMDWHYVSDPRVPHAGWTGYTWDEKLFPDPARFRREIHERKLKITLNDHPHGGIHSHEAAYEEMARFLGHTSPRFMEAYFGILHRRLESEACDFWIRGFDPFARNGRTPLIFSRYGGPGSHRWESLAFQPEFTATASNIGYGWWSHDIGGHIRGLGVFSPEPWLYGDECSAVMAKFLKLRHSLAPYLYTQNVPMYWSYPNDHSAYEVPNQYFLGSELLVAPIVQPRDRRTGLAAVRAWLPPRGRFVDILSGRVYDGDGYPVLAPEGSIITLDRAALPQNGCLNPEAVEVLVVVGQDGLGKLIEDTLDDTFQGSSPQSENRRKEWTIQLLQQKGELRASRVDRPCTFRLLGMASVAPDFKVVIDGHDRTATASITAVEYPDTPSIAVAAGQFGSTSDITIQLGRNPQLAVQDITARLEALIRGYQIEFQMKDQLWNAIEGAKGRPLSAISSLLSLGYDEAIVGPLVELISADSRSESSSVGIR